MDGMVKGISLAGQTQNKECTLGLGALRACKLPSCKAEFSPKRKDQLFCAVAHKDEFYKLARIKGVEAMLDTGGPCGNTDWRNQMTDFNCSALNCTEPAKVGGLCMKHYHREYAEKKKKAAENSPLKLKLRHPTNKGIVKVKEIGAVLENIPITVDFADYPELYDALVAMAKKEFRTPAQQILYLMQKGDHYVKDKQS